MKDSLHIMNESVEKLLNDPRTREYLKMIHNAKHTPSFTTVLTRKSALEECYTLFLSSINERLGQTNIKFDLNIEESSSSTASKAVE